MNSSNYIIDITAENFDQVIIQGSHSVPVLVDFWAPWCQPCKSLMPLLAALAEQYQGRFILAKINTEEQQALAAEFEIRSIPTVKLFWAGEAVDEFMGALPEGEIRTFIDRYIPRASDQLIAEAEQLIERGEIAQAQQQLTAASAEDPENPRILIASARLQALAGDIEAAEALLSTLPMDEQETPTVVELRARFTFERIAQAAPDSDTLKQRLGQDPNDSEARYQLAARRVIDGAHGEALELLLLLLQKDRSYGDDAARKGMLALFELLGGGGELVSRYRNRLFNALH